MLSCLAASNGGYFEISKMISSCVRASRKKGLGSNFSPVGGVEGTDEIVVEVDFLRRTLEFSSASSKIGDAGRELSWLESSEKSSEQSSSLLYGRNLPPWIGGKKLIHLPSMRPIWNESIR